MGKVDVKRISRLENHLLAALVQANEAMHDRLPMWKAKGAVRRAVSLFNLSESMINFYCMPTTAELPDSDTEDFH